MSFIRKKEIPIGSGNWYAYEVETYMVNGKKRQRVLQYIGKTTPLVKRQPKLSVSSIPKGTRFHPIKKGVNYQDVYDYTVLLRQDKRLSLDRIHKRVTDIFERPISRTVISKWIRPLIKCQRKGIILKSNFQFEPLEIALASKTGITLIDQLTENIRDRDFRNDVRQQAALIFLEKYGSTDYILTELEAILLVKQSIKKIRHNSYSSKYNTVYLHKNIGYVDGEEYTLLDRLSDKSSYGINPLDLVCMKETIRERLSIKNYEPIHSTR